MVSGCLDRDSLAAWSLGRLEPERLDEIAEHVEECDACRSSLDALELPADALSDELRRPVTLDPWIDEPGCREAVARFEAIGWELATLPLGDGHARTEPGHVPPGLASGSRIGPYEIRDVLGRGGMGAVYRARHTWLNRDVALKVLPADPFRHPQAVARFRREMESVGTLNHPNIVQASDAGEFGGVHYLAMELVEGVDLAQLVKQRVPLPVADACAIVRQAAEGLEHAARRGLVHRDIKPSNLMLAEDGRVKLLDLGLALLHGGPQGDEALTLSGQFMGTPEFMAPEQASDTHDVDVRADLYSLGCTLYFLLAGQSPFHRPGARNAWKTVAAHVGEPVPPIRGLRPDVP